MEQRRKRGGFLSFLNPLILYWIIQAVAVSLITTVLATVIYPELIAEASQGMTAENYAVFTRKVQEIMIRYSAEISILCNVIAIPIMLLLYYRDRKQDKVAGTEMVPARKPQLYLTTSIMLITASILLNNLINLSGIMQTSESFQDTSEVLHSVSFPIQLLGFGVIAPIAEELVYRGLCYRRLRTSVEVRWAILASSFIFAFEHGNLVQFIYAMIMGALLALTYERIGTFKAAMIGHCLANVTTMVLEQTGGFQWIFGSFGRVAVITVVCAAAASTMFVLIQREADPEIVTETE